MKKVLPLFIVLLCYSSISSAQYFEFFQQEYFFGWLPNPRTDAMGRADVAVGGSVASLFHNPAGIGLIEKGEFSISTAAPYYFLNRSDFVFLGAAYRFHPKMIVAMSANVLAVGETSFGILIGGTTYPTNKPNTSNFALTFTGTPVKNLHLGINLNYFRWKYIEEVKPSRVFHLDLGALYTYVLAGNDENPTRGLRLGVSAANASASDVTFSSPTGIENSQPMPIIGRYAVSYFDDRIVKLPGANEGSLSFLGTFEVQDLYNSDFRTAFKLGAEITAYDILSFRMGFYSRSENDMDISTNKDRISIVTYGFGLQIPVQQLSKGKIPLNLNFDYTSLAQPDLVTNSSFVPNMRSFGLRFVYVTNSNN